MSESFDYLIIGTGLSESMVGHQLVSSNDRISILQIDPNNHYGQDWISIQPNQLKTSTTTTTAAAATTSTTTPEATTPETTTTTTTPETTTTTTTPEATTKNYALSKLPLLVPARGSFVNALLSSNISSYLSFHRLHSFILAQPNSLIPLPGSKHDLFRFKSLNLIDKRLLMRLFQTILDSTHPIPQPNQSLQDYLNLPPFNISNPKLITIIQSLSLSLTQHSPAQPTINRLKKILSAIGRHPSTTISPLPAALLLGEYGGGGDWAEGFIRAAAITGRATQVLGRPILDLSHQEHLDPIHPWKIILGDQQQQQPSTTHQTLHFSARKLLISQDYLSIILPPKLITPTIAYTILRSIAILNRSQLDQLQHLLPHQPSQPTPSHALIVFPPEKDDDQAPVHALIVGPDTGSCPDDQLILYLLSIQTPSTNDSEPAQILQPVLDRLLHSLSSTPSTILRSSWFFKQLVHHLPDLSLLPPHSTIIPSWPTDLERAGFVEVVEWAAETAEKLVHDLA